MTRGLATLFCFSLFLTIAVNSAVAQEQDEELVLESNLVVMNAVVTDKNGNPVRGLAKDDFILTDNGVTQSIDFFESEENGFAAVILLDVSGSMKARVSLARSAAMRFLLGIRPKDFVSIYSFDSKPRLVQEFSNYKDVSERIYDLKAKGMTAMYDAIRLAASKLEERKEKRRAIIVLSDGADNRSGTSSSKALKAAQRANATVYTVDMSSINTGGGRRAQNKKVLQKFAVKTGGRFVKTPGGFALREAFENIVSELSVTNTLGFYPNGLKQDGKWHKLNLASRNGYEIRTREGYYATKD